MAEIQKLEKIASQVRRDIMRMVYIPQSGHPGGSLGCVDILTALFFEIMDHNPKQFDMDAKNQDVCFVSNGHTSPLFYSILARAGYFPVDELATFRKIGSRLQGHPATAEHLPGIRIAAGSLGQGLSVAVGCAVAKKMNKETKHVFCLMGDGEIQEGQIWEAAMFAGGKKVDNLIGMVDYNGQQIDGPVDEVMPLLNLRAKWEAFGWDVLEMDGNNMEEVVKTLNLAKSHSGKGKPVMILAHTIMGKGIDFMENNHKWHGSAPNAEQLANAMSQLEESLGDFVIEK